MKITRQQYDYAQRRMDELLAIVDNTVAKTDDRAVELTIMADIVKDYEKVNHPFGRPTVADIIRTALEEKNMTQRQLAYEIGVSPSRINDFISGRAVPSLKTAGKVCAALNIPPAVMMNA